MDKNIFQTNIKGHFIKSWIKFWDEDAVALEIAYPYNGLSLAGETKEGQNPKKLARELTQKLFDYCQFLESEMSNLKRAYFNYQQEREAWIEQNHESGAQKWYDTYLSDLIPFDLPPYTKMEVIDYIGKYRRPTMGGMVYLNRPDGKEIIQSCKLKDLEKSDRQLIADYNMVQANGFFGVQAQGSRVIGLHLAFKERFGKSPVLVTNNTLLEFSGPIRAVGNSWEHI